MSAVVAVRCSKTDSPAEDGGQHTGGGSAPYSSPAQVLTALNLVLSLAAESDASKNVIVQFWKSWGRASKYDYIKSPTRLFPNLAQSNGELPASSEKISRDFDSPALQALKHNKISRIDAGDCLKSNLLKHTDASVSAFTLNADLCFSIGNLTRVPPSTLLREVLSLVLHEATHLGGAPEEEAVGWQEEFSAYFGARLGDLETDTVSGGTFKSISIARALLAKALALATVDPKDAKIFGTVGKLAQTIASLPYFVDPLALELKVKPRRADLINNYSNSVLALIQKITIQFEIKSDVIKVNKGLHLHIDFMPPERVVPTLVEIAQDLNQIEENFIAFVGNNGDAHSVCVLPNGDVDLNIFKVDPHGLSTGAMAPRSCAPAH